VLTVALIVIPVIVSLLLIAMVLHTGKGGGLAEMFGGGIGQAAAGSTEAERHLDRATVAGIVRFFLTAIIPSIRLQ
jgi:preprotein translocase subunit SecG